MTDQPAPSYPLENLAIIIGRFMALIALIFCIPVFIICALAIKLFSPGKIFHISQRLGKNAETFNIFKFRTMHIDAENILQKVLAENPEKQQEWQKDRKLSKDPRVTKIGYFLRKSSLDELPQLLNIIKGEMQWVGPRPIQKDELIKYGNNAKLLHTVKPGLTGLWQVSGRSTLSYEKRVELDIKYIKERNAFLDIKIIAKTFLEIFKARGAY